MSQDLTQYIQRYFSIDDSEVDVIAKRFTLQSFSKGDYFLQEGKTCAQLSFVKSGMMRIFRQTDQKEVTQWISTPGYFVTDLASFTFEQPSRWTIQALSDSTLYSISKNDYHDLGSILPKWHELEKLFLAKCFTLLEDRVFALLSMPAEERYAVFYQQNPELFLQVPQQYLASLLGMTPETFSRIRAKFRS